MRQFLRQVANSRLKANILKLLLREVRTFATTVELAERTGERREAVRQAVQELSDAGVVNYCSSFGYSDLCYIKPHRKLPNMKSSRELRTSAVLELNRIELAFADQCAG